jgi:hypothetical protein
MSTVLDPTTTRWPPPDLTIPPPPVAPPHRRRRWPLWVALGVALTGLGVGGFVVLDRIALTHDLITANFDRDAAPFVTGNTGWSTATLVDGSYQLEAIAAPVQPIASFGMFSRTAFNVDIAVDIVAMDNQAGTSAAGLACQDLPTTNSHGYLFIASPAGYLIARTDQPTNTLLASSTASPTWPLVGHRLRITCDPSKKPVQIRGYVDDVEMLSATDADGFGKYQAGEMWFAPSANGDACRFDNFTARVPG